MRFLMRVVLEPLETLQASELSLPWCMGIIHDSHGAILKDDTHWGV